MAERSGMRTLLIGIDAACLPVLESLFETGDLPHLRTIVEGGVAGPLESQIPPWTPSAWPSLFTGMNPGKHGVFGFLDFDGYDWEVVDATHVCERPLWEILDYHGYSSVVVNVPVTSPPRPFDGALVPGYMAPEDPRCHPEGLLEDVRAAIGGYRIYPRGDGPDRYREPVRMRGAAFRYLVERFRPDFGFLEFQQTDTVFHERPDDTAAVREVYEAVDSQVGAVLDACEPDTVFVVSDHGIGRYGGVEFRVNEFLRDWGFVAPVKGGEGMPTWATVRDGQLKRGRAGERPSPGPLERAVAGVARFGLTSQRAAAVLETLGLADAVARHVPTDVIRAGTEQVDFPRSRAYVRSRIECGLRINLEGREPNGQVPREAYEEVRESLIAAFESIRTPAGEPVFEDVARREDYFDGPEVDGAVDIVTVPAGFDHFLSARLAGDQFGEPTEPWNHKRHGVIAARGRAVDADAGVDGAHLFDVAPTVLATFGIAADERMDGRVLPVVEPAGEREYPAFEPPAGHVTDDGTVEERLADLGYLE